MKQASNKHKRGRVEATCRLYNTEEEFHRCLLIRCSVFYAGRKRLDLGETIDELTRLPTHTQALLRIIFMRLW